MNWIGLIIQLISGVIGGNLAGGAMKNANLTPMVKSIAGLIGGLGGGQLLGLVGAGGAEGMDIAGLISSVVGGGAGGAILTAIAGMVMKAK